MTRSSISKTWSTPLFALLALGCQSVAPRIPEITGRTPSDLDCQTEVRLEESSGDLNLVLFLPPTSIPVRLRSLSQSAHHFGDIARIDTSGGSASLAREGPEWLVPNCENGCQIVFQFALSRSMRNLGRWRAAERIGRSFVISPSAWLLIPSPDVCRLMRVNLLAPEDFQFTHGAGQGRDLELTTKDLANLPPLVLGPSEVTPVAAGNGALRVVTERAHDYSADVFQWIEREAGSLTSYFGRFPVPSALLVLRPGAGGGAYHGSAHGHHGAIIKISVDREATEETLFDDWELLHEFVHLTLPNLDRSHRWMEEGLSTYLGVVIRRRMDRIDPQRFWGELSAGLPNALASNKRVGFNSNATWGETYWGGALYYLRVDLAIHEATEGRFGLRDVLLEIQRRGGDIRVSWKVEDLFLAEEAATGTSFMRSLHEEMGERRSSFDVEAELEALGLRGRGRRVELVADAPRAELRRSFEAWTLPR